MEKQREITREIIIRDCVEKLTIKDIILSIIGVTLCPIALINMFRSDLTHPVENINSLIDWIKALGFSSLDYIVSIILLTISVGIISIQLNKYWKYKIYVGIGFCKVYKGTVESIESASAKDVANKIGVENESMIAKEALNNKYIIKLDTIDKKFYWENPTVNVGDDVYLVELDNRYVCKAYDAYKYTIFNMEDNVVIGENIKKK